MALVAKEVQVPKEYSEVLALLVAIVEDVKQGKTAGEISAENLQGLIVAIEGAEKISAEFAEHQQEFITASALAGSKFAGLFLPKSA